MEAGAERRAFPSVWRGLGCPRARIRLATDAPMRPFYSSLPMNRSFSARFWTAAAERSEAAAFGETQRRGCTRSADEALGAKKAVASHAQSMTLSRR